MKQVGIWKLPTAFVMMVFFCAFLDSASGLNQKGNQLYKEKKYQSALEAYRQAQVKKPRQPEVLYNLGTALYQTDQFGEAASQFEQVVNLKSTDPSLLANNWYNYGNAQYRTGQFDKAVEAYKKTLELNPKDKDAKHNLELLLKKKGLFEKKQEKRNQERQKESQQKNQNQESQSQQGGGGAKRQDQKSEGQAGSDQNQGQHQDQQDQNEEKHDAEQQPKENKEEQESDKSQRENEERQQDKKKDESQERQTANQERKQDHDQEPQNEQKLQPGRLEPQNAKEPQYFQGQMSKEDAFRILDALRDSEKELQLLRQPKPVKPSERSARDW